MEINCGVSLILVMIQMEQLAQLSYFQMNCREAKHIMINYDNVTWEVCSLRKYLEETF